jgi:hypothetical protein
MDWLPETAKNQCGAAVTNARARQPQAAYPSEGVRPLVFGLTAARIS